MNRNHAPIQNEEGLLAFTLEDIIDPNANPHIKELAPKELQRPFIINLNYKKEREECAKKINEITHECFAWTKEKFGKRHWVLYNTKAFRVVLGGIIQYNSEYGVAPFMPVNATTCYKMFSDITEDVLISFYNFNTENIINMDRMFEGCKSRLQLNLMCFNTKKVERMYRMFADCTKIELLDIRSFDLSSTTTLREMFSCDTSLSTIGINDSALAQIY